MVMLLGTIIGGILGGFLGGFIGVVIGLFAGFILGLAGDLAADGAGYELWLSLFILAFGVLGVLVKNSVVAFAMGGVIGVMVFVVGLVLFWGGSVLLDLVRVDKEIGM